MRRSDRISHVFPLAVVLVALVAVVATAASSYRLRVEVTTTSELLRIELEGGGLLVRRWEFASTPQKTVSGYPSIEVWQSPGKERSMSLIFDVVVTPEDTGELTWSITKGEAGFALVQITSWYEEGEETPSTILRCSLHSEGTRPSKLALADLEAAPTVPWVPDPDSETFCEPEEFLDLAYAEVPGVDPSYLSLDLYLPARDLAHPVPLVVWIHGGGFTSGDKAPAQFYGTFASGYAIASINYRLADIAKFPAPIHDSKAAVRWLRAHAADYGYDPDRIFAWGASAGAELAGLLGTSAENAELEGTLGEHLDQSSAVQAVCSYYGISNLLTVAEQTIHGNQLAAAIDFALGGSIDDLSDLAWLTSPMAHIDADDPPFLLVHGDADDTCAPQQSIDFHEALVAAGVDSELILIENARHGGTTGWSGSILRAVRAFLDRVAGDES